VKERRQRNEKPEALVKGEEVDRDKQRFKP
jgi:hypothetical protein